MDFLEVSLPSNRFWSNSEAKFRQNWDFANRMRSVVSVVSTDNFVTAARQGRLSLLRLRTLCQSKVFLAIFRYFGLFWPKNGILYEYFFLLFCFDFLLCFYDFLTRFFREIEEFEILKFASKLLNVYVLWLTRPFRRKTWSEHAFARVSQLLCFVERGSRDYDMEKMTCTLWSSERLFSKAEILYFVPCLR